MIISGVFYLECLQVKRVQQVNRHMEQPEIEKILKQAVSTMHNKNVADKTQLEAKKSEKQSLTTKLERKKSDYERLKHRLDTLQKIRYCVVFVGFLSLNLA